MTGATAAGVTDVSATGASVSGAGVSGAVVSGAIVSGAGASPAGALAAAAVTLRGSALAPASAPRPGHRPRTLGAASATRTASAAPPAATAAAPVVADAAGQRALEAWVRGFRGRALSQGISAATFDRAMRNVRYLPDVVRLDRNQAEFTRPIWDYLASAVSETRVANGRAALARHRATLDRISRRYGVEPEVIVAVWGLESNYGSNKGSTPILDAMATLAHDGRRARFFEEQLVATLRIVQAGDIAPERMLGSWAGAMGHTQFMPTSYLAYAQDFTGNGRRDIWSDDPTDALASTAHYLARFGWRRGQPWGMEVVLPRGFDFAQSGKRSRKTPAQWNALGVRLATGGPIPDHGPASILLPAGARGAAFVIFDNFHVISRYNSADAYVIAVGHLADRIAGGGPLRASWPTGDRNLTSAERREMQERLTRRGFDTRGVDGIVGPNTIAAVRQFQSSVGMVPDGYASFEVLRRLR
ncbi:MAG: lytic murein transglycosylase [Rhodobacteraceae bacterium]|nr:lytic murein transglycosylase [Paracoccaceae bacterium]